MAYSGQGLRFAGLGDFGLDWDRVIVRKVGGIL